MLDFKEITVGLILFVVTSLIAYLFRMRQLYVVVPKLYSKSSLTSDGGLYDVKIYNRGNHPEEEIGVAFDPGLKIELVATDTSDLVVSNNSVEVARLHKSKSASALIMVEGGVLDHTKILGFSSKATPGEVLKSLDDVPPNWAKTFAACVLMVSMFPAVYFGLEFYSEFKEQRLKSQLSYITAQGWTDLKDYYESELRKTYTDKEFPIKFISSKKIVGSDYEAKFEIMNKTALAMQVYIDSSGGRETHASTNYKYWDNVTVPALTKKDVVIQVPSIRDNNSIELAFSLVSDDASIHGMLYKLKY